MALYTIKRTAHNQGFEVSGPEKEWVEAQAEVLAQQFEVSDSVLQPSPGSHSASTHHENKMNTTSQNGMQLKLSTDTIAQLVEYVGERQIAFDKAVTNQAVIIAKFLKDKLSTTQIDQHDLAYIYKQVGMWSVVNHRKQIDNAADKKKYFTRNGGKFELNYAGEKFAQDTAKNEGSKLK